MKNSVGKHVIADLFECENIPDNIASMRKLMKCAVKETNGTLLKISDYKFSPHGITMVALLSESHVSIHTWPEKKFACLDAFTCGSHTDPLKAIKFFCSVFQPKKKTVKKISRA